MASTAPMKLYYFSFPGRAEPARLMLTMAKKNFVDKRISWDEWSELKPKMPFGQVPVLEQDGKMLAQMTAIDRYVASITGMLPPDPWQLACAEQGGFLLHDIWELLGKPMMLREASAEEKQQAWEKLLEPEGMFRKRLGMLNDFVAKREGKFLAGDALCYVDLVIFCNLSLFQSGWFEDVSPPGLPRDILDSYPALKEFRSLIASLPDVAAFYAKEEDDVRKNGFRPDGEAPAGTA